MTSANISQIITVEAQHAALIVVYKSNRRIAYSFQYLYTDGIFSRNTDQCHILRSRKLLCDNTLSILKIYI